MGGLFFEDNSLVSGILAIMGILGAFVLAVYSLTLPPPPAATEPAEPPLRIGGRVQRPEVIVREEPEYPRLALLGRVEGTVELSAVITKEGRVEKIEVVRGHPLLAAAAVDCVRRWRYKPGTLNETPIDVPTTIEVRFHLKRQR